jgi:7-cyano-7-deazaguanine tRNA-ribosyltransferase
LSFEVRNKDLLGRIGLLHTRHGNIETPLLLPVVNPNTQAIPAKDLRSNFGFDAIITNSYLVWRRHREDATPPKIHELLNFDGVIATDSGAYQILQYGDVEVQPSEIIRFEEQLGSDIAVILDVPTDQDVSRKIAKWSVDETLRRADDALKLISRHDVLWIGPVQGGVYPDLVAYSAAQMAMKDFSIYALGSPTTVMQQYHYDSLVDMIVAAKQNLPPNKPLHLFGAGHPMMFALAVALGCDIFDSASYALFARNARYMTTQGTAKFEDLEYFPCNCPACHNKTPNGIRKLLLMERERFLAAHNLHACQTELQTVKQALVDGRLWELVETRCRSHPALQLAFQRLLKYAPILEPDTPLHKKKGPFVIDADSLNRPEIVRYEKSLLERYSPPAQVKNVILLPEHYMKPFQENPDQDSFLSKLKRRSDVHLCAYGLVFGVVPEELLDVYPISQTEDALTPTSITVRRATSLMFSYLSAADYSLCIIVTSEPWQLRIGKAIKAKRSKGLKVRIIEMDEGEKPKILAQILGELKGRKRRQRIS